MTGYIMIDCGGLDLTSQSSQTISGLYAKCKAALATDKPVYAVNCKYGTGHPMTPIAVFLQQENSTKIIGTSSILQIHVTSEDAVTIVSMLS